MIVCRVDQVSLSLSRLTERVAEESRVESGGGWGVRKTRPRATGEADRRLFGGSPVSHLPPAVLRSSALCNSSSHLFAPLVHIPCDESSRHSESTRLSIPEQSAEACTGHGTSQPSPQLLIHTSYQTLTGQSTASRCVSTYPGTVSAFPHHSEREGGRAENASGQSR